MKIGLAKEKVGLGWETVACTAKKEWGLDGKEWFGKVECRRVRDGAVWRDLRRRGLVKGESIGGV
jgi:hypothetical protein